MYIFPILLSNTQGFDIKQKICRFFLSFFPLRTDWLKHNLAFSSLRAGWQCVTVVCVCVLGGGGGHWPTSNNDNGPKRLEMKSLNLMNSTPRCSLSGIKPLPEYKPWSRSALVVVIISAHLPLLINLPQLPTGRAFKGIAKATNDWGR